MKALKLVATEVSLIQKERQLTRNVFVDAMKEKLNMILIGVVEKIETNIASTNEDNIGKLQKQNNRTLKFKKDVSCHTKSIESATERVNSLDTQLVKRVYSTRKKHAKEID